MKHMCNVAASVYLVRLDKEYSGATVFIHNGTEIIKKKGKLFMVETHTNVSHI